MISYHSIHHQSYNDCYDSHSGYYDQLFRSLKTTKRNVMLQLVLGRTLCSVINLIAKTHFQHVQTSGHVVQKPIPAELMRATVTVTIIVLEI